jgi:translation elongation factor EF-4
MVGRAPEVHELRQHSCLICIPAKRQTCRRRHAHTKISKQKEGKKMMEFGKVGIPKEALIAALAAFIAGLKVDS